MSIADLRNKIERLKSSIGKSEEKSAKNGLDEKQKPSAKRQYDFREKKAGYYFSSLERSYNDLRRELFEAVSEAKGQEPVFDLILLWKELQQSKGDAARSKEILGRMSDAASKISISSRAEPKAQSQISIRIPKLPDEIKADAIADMKEIEKCFNDGLYRSATILCGRVLETALHRKYYEATGNDALEKSPGIGLGNLIAKLKEKNIELDPAITQQIHLINQVRIFTVHRKKEAFMPSKEQCHAIILYTMDVVGRMFVS